jgi:hypothetical protein
MVVEKHPGLHVASVFFVRFQPKVETTIKLVKINVFNIKFLENLLGGFRVTCLRTDGQSDFNTLSAGSKIA